MTQTSAPPPTPADSHAESTSLGERNFVLVCLSHVLGYFSNSLVNPVLPLFLVAQGNGESFVGLVLAAFSVVSFAVRLPTGQMVDAGKVRATLTAGGLFLGLAPLAYLVPFTPLLFLARGVHGLGWACLNVAGSAWAGMLAPSARRAEALGYFTMAQRIGGTAAQVLALWLAARVGFEAVFVLAGVMGFVTAAGVRFTDPRRAFVRAAGAPGSVWRSVLNVRALFAIEKAALLGAGLQTLSIMTAPAAFIYIPLYFKSQAIDGVELYFLAIGTVGILGRWLVGPWADRLGRMKSVAVGFALQLIGLTLLGFEPGFAGIMLAGVLHTFGNVCSEPSLYATALDRSPSDRRGAAMATYTSAFQLGSGIGAALGGVIIERWGYEVMYRATLVPVLVGLAWLAVQARLSARAGK